jgi:hypothetical protein
MPGTGRCSPVNWINGFNTGFAMGLAVSRILNSRGRAFTISPQESIDGMPFDCFVNNIDDHACVDFRE